MNRLVKFPPTQPVDYCWEGTAVERCMYAQGKVTAVLITGDAKCATQDSGYK